MFNNIKEVQQAEIQTLIDLVETKNWQAGLEDILSEDLMKGYEAAKKIVGDTESLAEGIAYAIRTRVQDILDEKSQEDSGDDNDDIDSFMNALAGEMGLLYNGEWENRPDAFWEESSC